MSRKDGEECPLCRNGKLNFAREYKKLRQNTFATIRLETDLEEGELVDVTVDGEKVGTAHVCQIEQMLLKDINDESLKADTDTSSRKEAIQELRKFYPDLDESSEIVVIFLIWKDSEVDNMTSEKTEKANSGVSRDE